MQTDLNIRVLTDDFVQRLAKMNHVSRQLRRQYFGCAITQSPPAAWMTRKVSSCGGCHRSS